MIVFENDRFYLNDLRPFFIRLLLKKRSFLKKTIVFENTFYWQLCYNSLSIVNGGSSLAIVNEGLSLTIVNETTNFIKMVVFRKKITCNLIEYRLTRSLTVLGELKLLDIFLKTTQLLVQMAFRSVSSIR